MYEDGIRWDIEEKETGGKRKKKKRKGEE